MFDFLEGEGGGERTGMFWQAVVPLPGLFPGAVVDAAAIEDGEGCCAGLGKKLWRGILFAVAV